MLAGRMMGSTLPKLEVSHATLVTRDPQKLKDILLGVPFVDNFTKTHHIKIGHYLW